MSCGAQTHPSGASAGTIMARRHYERVPPQTVGWSDCGHNDYRPGTVRGPFLGGGIIAVVEAVIAEVDRHAVGIELSADYLELAARRLAQQSLFTEASA